MPHVYFGLAPNTAELEAVRLAKPACLLVSYAYWKHKRLDWLIERIGYRPRIFVDSGAFTFYNQGTNTHFGDFMDFFQTQWSVEPRLVLSFVNDLRYNSDVGIDDDVETDPLSAKLINNVFVDYVDWLLVNRSWIDHVVAFDHIQSPEKSHYAFLLMQHLGVHLIPAFHLGSPMDALDQLIDAGASYIGLGGMASKRIRMQDKANFVNACIDRYPSVPFHFFGSLDYHLWRKIPRIHSVDGQSWLPTFQANIKPGETKVTQGAMNLAQKEQMASTWSSWYPLTTTSARTSCP